MEAKETTEIAPLHPLSSAAHVRLLRDRVTAASPALADELMTAAYLSTLEGLADDAARSGVLKEFRFTSHVPIVGPVLAALRSAFNSIATRWVVRALIQQQNRFNAANIRLLRETLALNRALLARVRELETRVATLESHAADTARPH
jgi:hypothetical protein